MVNYSWLIVPIQTHRNHVKPGRCFAQPVGLEILLGNAGKLPLLTRIDGFKGGTKNGGMPGLDLDKNQRTAIPSNDIDLAARSPVIFFDDGIALTNQKFNRQGFTQTAGWDSCWLMLYEQLHLPPGQYDGAE